MKKFLCVLCAMILMVSSACVAVSAADNEAYVIIADENGKLVVIREAVELSDADNDGSITVNDALIIAHDKFFEGGSEAGYGYYSGDYGLSMSKLWGIENGGSYGYCVNNALAWSLADPVAAGDTVYAYVYTDTVYWSDTYSWFDVETADTTTADTVSLTLSAMGYDENWNTVVKPVEGAVITINGEATETVTDANGQASLNITEEGSYVISAVSDTVTLVPPVCVVTVTADTTAEAPTEDIAQVPTEDIATAPTEDIAQAPTLPATGVASANAFYGVAVVLVLMGAAFVLGSKKRVNEN